jgi:hypothetical protein
MCVCIGEYLKLSIHILFLYVTVVCFSCMCTHTFMHTITHLAHSDGTSILVTSISWAWCAETNPAHE